MTKSADIKKWDELRHNPPENWREVWNERKKVTRFDSSLQANQYAFDNQEKYDGLLRVDLHPKDGYVVYQRQAYNMTPFYKYLCKEVKDSYQETIDLIDGDGSPLPGYSEAADKHEILHAVKVNYENLNQSSNVGITIEGGRVQNVFAEQQVELLVIDYDTDGIDEDSLIKIPQNADALVYLLPGDVMPQEFEQLASVIDKARESGH